MTAENAVLLLVDLQQRLMPAINDGDTVIARADRLAEAATILGVPVLATEQSPDKLGPTVEPLAGYPDPVHAKSRFAADPALLPGGRSEVVVAGAEAHVCVLQTVLELARAGDHRVLVVADAVGSQDPDDKAAALQRARAAGAEVVTSEMVMFEWLGDADHPRFRDVQRLLK